MNPTSVVEDQVIKLSPKRRLLALEIIVVSSPHKILFGRFYQKSLL